MGEIEKSQLKIHIYTNTKCNNFTLTGHIKEKRRRRKMVAALI